MGNVETVKMLIPDTDESNRIFTDPQIQGYLTINGDDVRLATADALEAIATDEILTYRITRTDDQSVNGVTGAEALLRRAATLRDQAAESWNNAFDIHYPTRRVHPEAAARPVLWG